MKPAALRYLSVCSGIEAATCAWHSLGWKPTAFAEIEPFPSAVLAHHYPDVPNLGDMTQIALGILSMQHEAPDLLVGGTPCQAFSVAGLRNSLDDDRGQLSLSFIHLADSIDAVRRLSGKPPAVVVWENVPGVLSTKDNAFGCFLAGLAGEDSELQPSGKRWPDAGCVYGPQRTVAWRILDAQYFGVAQRRRRVFVVASARQGFDPAAVLFERHSLSGNPAPRREAGQGSAAGTLRCTDGGSDVDHGRAGHLIPFAPALSHCLNAGGMGRQDCVSSTDVFGALGSSSPQAQAVSYAIQAGALRTNPNSGPDGVGVQEHIAYTLEARAEVQAVCVTGDITHTLKAEGFDASEDGTGRGQPIVTAADIRNSRIDPDGPTMTLQAGGIGEGRGMCINAIPHAMQAMAVRRLTPRECERLQGFPDGHTRIPQRLYKTRRVTKLRPADMWEKVEGGWMLMAADGPRYKALGNSMCVNVMAWIGRRIDEALA